MKDRADDVAFAEQSGMGTVDDGKVISLLIHGKLSSPDEVREAFDRVRRLQHVRSLSIQAVVERDYMDLGLHPHLTELTVAGLPPVGANGPKWIGQHEKLAKLSLYYVDEAWLGCLAHLPELSELLLNGSFTGSGLESVPDNCKVRKISVRNS